jgi:hypothetical protein
VIELRFRAKQADDKESSKWRVKPWLSRISRERQFLREKGRR